MFVDNMAELATTVAFDLETARPGPGNQIKLAVILDSPGDLVITDGATATAADALMTVSCTDKPTEVHLPSTTKQFIKATFAGRVFVSLCGIQTNT